MGSGVEYLCFQVESKVSATGVTQRVQLFNYEMGEYVDVDSRSATLSDRVVYIAVDGDPDPYIDGSGNVKAHILFDDVGVVAESWLASFDHVIWFAL